VLDGATTHVGASSALAAPITNLATITVAPTANIKVIQRCGHDTVAGNFAYLDPDASLVAFKAIDGLDVNQMATTTTNQTLINSSPVLSMTLPDGRWAIGFKVTGISLVAGGNGQACWVETTVHVTPTRGDVGRGYA